MDSFSSPIPWYVKGYPMEWHFAVAGHIPIIMFKAMDRCRLVFGIRACLDFDWYCCVYPLDINQSSCKIGILDWHVFFLCNGIWIYLFCKICLIPSFVAVGHETVFLFSWLAPAIVCIHNVYIMIMFSNRDEGLARSEILRICHSSQDKEVIFQQETDVYNNMFLIWIYSTLCMYGLEEGIFEMDNGLYCNYLFFLVWWTYITWHIYIYIYMGRRVPDTV